MNKKISDPCIEIISVLLLILPIVINAQIIDSTKTTIQSPDKNLTIRFYQKSLNQGKRQMYYQVSFKNKPVINESDLDIQLDNHLSESAMALPVDRHEKWCENLVVKKITTTSKDTTWRPVCGERTEIRDHYNASTIELVKDDNPIYEMHVEIRAYNEGAALRYFFPENPKGTYYRVIAENTEFSLPAGTKAYYTGWAQGPYQLLPLANWPDESERPLTLQLGNGLFTSLAEARMVDYTRTKFKLSKTKQNTILTSMYEPADLISPVGSPWRVIMVAEKPGELVEHNYLILNLNDPGKIKDVSWIKPGKIIREMTLTTPGAMAAVDFAAQHNIQYILFDWKWYGPAFSFSSDATKVVVDLDLPGVIKYGKEKGVGIWMYVNLQALTSQMDSLFSVLSSWGVKGVKFGFVQVGSHRWTTWVEDAIKKAAENHLMVNIHDDWRPTGEQRTWPNLMTAEGIRGNEEMPEATHNTILPFTRYIAGAADYTISYYTPRIKTTHAHQLAMAAVYYSPLQTIFWYDKPSDYQGEPEIEFFEKIPAVWDETKVLQGEPGQYITTARRSGNDWFVGTMTNNDARNMQLSLGFLAPGKKYVASIYSDDPAVKTRTKVKVERKNVTASTVLDVKLLASGGQAIWLRATD